MKNLLLIYNPFSGARNFKQSIDTCIDKFTDSGYITTTLRLNRRNILDDYFAYLHDKDFFDTIVISGGDGTINIVINAMMKHNVNAKIGVIPSGTANDFATYLGIPKSPREAANIISNSKLENCDIGQINGIYFINVLSGGLLTNISQHIIEEFKSIFGKLTYYIKGIEQIPNFEPIPIRVTTNTEVFEDEIFMFFLLNTGGAGGFEKIVPDASLNDGEFDFVAIKVHPIKDVARLFLKIFSGKFIDEPEVIYFRDNYFKIEVLSDNPLHMETDIDGELGPNLPAEVKNIKHAIQIYIP